MNQAQLLTSQVLGNFVSIGDLAKYAKQSMELQPDAQAKQQAEEEYKRLLRLSLEAQIENLKLARTKK